MVDGTVTETPDQSELTKGLGRVLPPGPYLWGRTVQGWRWLRLVFAGVWLVYLAQPLSTLHDHHHSAGLLAAAIAITAVFCVTFVVVVSCWDRYPALSRCGYVLLFVLAAALSLMFPGTKAGGNVVWIYVSSATGWAITGRREAKRAVLAVSACFLLFSWLGHNGTSNTLVTLIPVVLVGIMSYGIRAQMRLMRELAKAREAETMLAANEERLRLARDMHDLTGQSLSMITLKSELAARLLRRLPEGPDRDRVAEEIQQVADVSRQALHDIREAISGYRRPTLAVEVITARAALESAGITPHDDSALTLLSGTFGPDAEAALAWCLREAVTNVIRHSGAQNCYIRLTRRDGTLALEVRDDGRGARPAAEAAGAAAAAGSDGAAAAAAGAAGGLVPRSSGTGLHGMSERLCAVGGSLELRPDASGFRLVARVPAVLAGEGDPRDAGDLGGSSGSGGSGGSAGSAAQAPAGVTVTT
jgi:two-component system, NarL family, sensor histidine kinase DesK